MFRLNLLSAVGMLLAGCAATRYAAVPDSEARACGGISEDAQEMGPFARMEEITSVAPLVIDDYPRTNPPLQHTVGAVVTVRAGSGITSEWLQRMVDCQLARYSARGYPASEGSDSPLGFRGASARVRSTGDGFAIEIRSNERDTAREILASAERLYHQPRFAAKRSASQEGE